MSNKSPNMATLIVTIVVVNYYNKRVQAAEYEG